MDDELLDLVNENDEVIGTVRHSESLKTNKLIVRIGTVYVLNSKGEVLMGKKRRNNLEGTWSLGCGGHIKAGEDPRVGTLRELQEELGIQGDIEFLHKGLYKDEHTARFVYVYKLLVDDDVEIPFGDEYSEIRWMNIATPPKDMLLTTKAMVAMNYLRGGFTDEPFKSAKQSNPKEAIKS